MDGKLIHHASCFDIDALLLQLDMARPNDSLAFHAHPGLQAQQYLATVHQQHGDHSIKLVDKHDALDAQMMAAQRAASEYSQVPSTPVIPPATFGHVLILHAVPFLPNLSVLAMSKAFKRHSEHTVSALTVFPSAKWDLPSNVCQSVCQLCPVTDARTVHAPPKQHSSVRWRLNATSATFSRKHANALLGDASTAVYASQQALQIMSVTFHEWSQTD